MKIITIIEISVLLAGIGIVIYSCKYDNAASMPCNSVPDVVSFSNDILPLFNVYCNSAGCHAGASPPAHLNLVDSLAYSELMKPGTGNVDTLNPTFSVVYTSMTTSSKIMPPSGKLNDCKISLVLKWIQQGAKNN